MSISKNIEEEVVLLIREGELQDAALLLLEKVKGPEATETDLKPGQKLCPMCEGQGGGYWYDEEESLSEIVIEWYCCATCDGEGIVRDETVDKP